MDPLPPAESTGLIGRLDALYEYDREPVTKKDLHGWKIFWATFAGEHIAGTEFVIEPYQRFAAAGFDVTVITPDGQPPHADPYGLSWFFHYPEADKDYLASVVRTFAHDVDDIRILYGTIGFALSTHDAGGAITAKDTALATRLTALATEHTARPAT